MDGFCYTVETPQSKVPLNMFVSEDQQGDDDVRRKKRSLEEGVDYQLNFGDNYLIASR